MAQPPLPSLLPPSQALGGGLTAESLATPAGEALVARCLHLHERLASLSQLEPPQGSPLVPLVRRAAGLSMRSSCLCAELASTCARVAL